MTEIDRKVGDQIRLWGAVAMVALAQPQSVGLRLFLSNALLQDGKPAEALAIVEHILTDPALRASIAPGEVARIRAFRDALRLPAARR